MVAPDVLTDWLLESEETMPDTERSNRRKTATPNEIAGETFARAVQQWIDKPDSLEALGEKAKVHPTSISRNFTKYAEGKVVKAVCKALKIDFRKLREGKIEPIPETPDSNADEELDELIARVPESKLEQAKQFIRFLIGN